MGELVLLALALLAGCVLGWVAFFRTLSLSKDIENLRKEILALKDQGASLQAQAAAQPASSRSSYEENVAPPQAPPPAADRPAPLEAEAEKIAPPGIDAPPTEDAVAARILTEDAHASSGADAQESVSSNSSANVSDGGLEQRLAGSWLIWLGGAALALGGAFLVKSAIDAGFFGPGMRIFSAFCAGWAMIAASEWLRRTEPETGLATDDDGDDEVEGGASPAALAVERLRGNSLAPPVLAAAGGATLYGTIYAAYGLYQMLPALAALFLLTAACGGMVVLAALHRAPLVALLGLIGAYVSPLLTASGEPNPDALMLYVYGVSAAGLVVARVMAWRGVSYAALAGGIVWPLIWVAAADGHVPASLYIYPPAYLLLAAFIAWEDAKNPFDADKVFNNGVQGVSVSLAAFYFAALAVAGLALLITFEREAAPQAVAMWGSISILTLICAWRREAFSIAPILIFAATLFLVAFTEFGESFAQLRTGIAFAALFGVGGYAVMNARAEKGPAAMLTAFAPIAFLAALFHQAGQPAGAFVWSLAAFALVGVNTAILTAAMRRPDWPDAHPGAASALVLGAALASTLAVAMYADGFMMSAGIALQAPVLAWLWRRFHLPALKYAAGALAALATLRLFWLPEVLAEDFGALPVLNWLVVAYLLPAAGFWVSAIWLRGGGLAPNSRILQGLEGGAIALFAAFVTLQIRHLMNGGVLDQWDYTLTEVSLQTINWITIAAFLRWRYGNALTTVRRIAELALIALAGAHMALFNLSFLNPWWGGGPAVHGPPVFNLLLLAYLLPAAAFAALAFAAQRSRALVQSRGAGLFAAFLGYCWLVLSIRHSFHAPDLSTGRIGDAESWVYSIATILFATLLLVAGVFLRSAVLRFAGLGALMLAVCKVFLFDMAGLDGVWRASSFLGLGAALVGIAVLYQRLLAPMLAAGLQADDAGGGQSR